MFLLCQNAHSQTVHWNKDKFPDYTPELHINKAQQKLMMKNVKLQAEKGKVRPDHWNNALSNAFPPVMNQSAGSCGSASRIYYMFAHEMNAARWADGSKAENIYPTHFTWLLTWTPGGQGKEILATHNGIPNSAVYGGYTYSDVFGYQDCDDGQSNYGWMQGYDKWLHAMNNRITGSANFPAVDTEEGRELVKNYLWNHCGDETYSTGGIVGVGVASGGNWQKIPKTETNDAIGVTNKYYVHKWGTSVDHALTIVGYDDRIEFDLDGNGVKGEADKDEIGAWIVVNSWGSGWCNGGFIYCPYAEARPTATATGYWGPEYYTPRRNYRPLRTLKVKMDYDHRSEIALYVGVSKDLNATQPDKETWLRHFYYSGLGKGVTVNASNPDPEIPMLGKWADGTLHTEPMEFGYDLTDLVSEYEDGASLKYFFRVETRSWAAGAGTIYSASIIDYTTDREGIEFPFDLSEEGTQIANAGQKTTITATARTESIPAPRNLSLDGNTLSWQTPTNAPFAIKAYRIYKDGNKLFDVEGQTLSAQIDGAGTYYIAALYTINEDFEVESKPSAGLAVADGIWTTDNELMTFENSGSATIKGFTKGTQSAYTIEFWLKPGSSKTDFCGLKASSGKFFFKLNSARKIEIGFDGGDYAVGSSALSTLKSHHIAIVVNEMTMRVYVNGTLSVTRTSGYSNSGIGGANNLLFGKSEGTTSNNKAVVDAPWIGTVDELRIWNYARSVTQIKNAYQDSYTFPNLQEGLTHYYKMNTREEDGTTFLVDAIGQNDIELSQDATFTPLVLEAGANKNPLKHNASANFAFSSTTTAIGQPVTITDNSAPSTTQWAWEFTGAEHETLSTNAPVVIFNEAGQQTVTLTTTNIAGETATVTKNITVTAAQAPTADFALPSGTLAVGDHLTFVNTSTPIDQATYTWTLIGAEVETLNTTNATATYPANGTYKVRLEARNTAGVSSVEKEVEVVKVAPMPAFTIKNNVVLINEPINLIDNSKYEPAGWEWLISNSTNTYLVNNCQSGSIKIDRPGRYDVTLKASNDIGSATITRQRAITVCNADGQQGLNFDNADDQLVAASPLSSINSRKFTLEWWMYPGSITTKNCKIGDSEATFMLVTNADKSMTAYLKNIAYSTEANFVIENEWHHYAVTFNYTSTTNIVISFYRDGELIKSITLPGNAPGKWSNFNMGGSDAPMNAIVDEVRLWKAVLTADQICTYANAPIEDPSSESSLVLYYDFNQTSGDVIDRKGSKDGVRSNFGPDGDAWSDSKGIFFLDYTADAKDVTASYLKNYKAAFTTGSGNVNTISRFRKLGTPWIQENSVVNGNIITEFHVDTNKGSALTLSTTWDSFASGVTNLKLYQTTTLPAGAYQLSTTTNHETAPASNFLVVAEGTGLPDYKNIGTSLGYAKGNEKCHFILTSETPVSVGILSNQSGQSCHTVGQFKLLQMPFSVIEAGEIIDGVEQVKNEVNVTPTLQAYGGLGCILVSVDEPQHVEIFDLSGKLIWSEFVISQANISARKGLYIVNRQKVVVR